MRRTAVEQVLFDEIDIVVHVQRNGISAAYDRDGIEAYTQRDEAGWRLITVDGGIVEAVRPELQPTLELMWQKVEAVWSWMDDPSLARPSRVRSSASLAAGARR